MGKEEVREKWVDEFISGEAYDKMNAALYVLSIAAFEAGWDKCVANAVGNGLDRSADA